MREVAFIKQNKDQWLAFEKTIFSNQTQKPDFLADMYIQIMNDLSYAQTFYPKSKVTQYLNNLAAQTYQKIYKLKRIEENRISYFFKTEVPLTIYQYRNYLKFSVLAFLIITAIGVISAHYDLNFSRAILGDSYVNMTLNNIESGDVMGVYKSGSNWGSFISITANNLNVGLRFFVYGVFGGIGTLFFLFQNAIMLGTFQYLFVQHNAFMDSFRGIWLHGAMEITAMVIEAFAGFIFGGSLLFPKTFSRMNSFKIGFKAGFKIFIATIPFTIAAGFIEGYITRYAKEMPDIINYLIIFGTLAIIVYYFFIYPYKVHRKLNPLH
ncbi:MULTISPECIES: stage II sporulation protein M [Myroides]|uniref:Stage II sporulation protein M n=1 Tax=Myroides albus TaxID=2562892 RepID=A0A6I3LHU9_9FLAO|nr:MULTISPECIES: stage II sporulation protein M [Myroides]MTG97156.1 stage II sporulation protein M [Myroides albus]MVX35153.1 stage II sporulation protein M [Myroides sp. LoEW2-1]